MAVKCFYLNLFLKTVFKYLNNYQHIKACTCWGMKVLEDFQMGHENLKGNLDGLGVFLRKNYISFRPGPGY